MTDTTAAGGDAGAPTTTTEAPIVDSPIIDLDAPVEPQTEPEADGEPTDKAGEDAGEDGKPKKPSGAQRAKAREAKLLSELSARDRELEQLRAAAKPADKAEALEPKETDYPDYFTWQRALTAFEAGNVAREAVRKELETKANADRQTTQQNIARERQVAHAERVETAQEVIADFDEIMSTMKDVNVRQDVIDEIMSSDNSAVIAYHLAKNPDKLYAMDRMSPRELAREMGRLEATVKLPEAKKATTAPPPLSRVTGAAAPASQESNLNAWLKKVYG